ncbi:MAG: hypothetical protein H6517_02295 [Microthrixaceae bacterium]|nr:hypothetical protein [Microthrixaceae bacterium]
MSGDLQRVWIEGVTAPDGGAGATGVVSALLAAGADGVRFQAVSATDGLRLRAAGSSRRRSRKEISIGDIDALGRDAAYDLVVDATDVTTATAVVDSARRAGMLENLWLVSTELATLVQVREESPATRLLHECDPARERHGAERHAATLRAEGLEGVLVAEDKVGLGATTLMHRFGRMVAVTGVDYPRHLRRARAAGVDIICGSDPAMLTTPG